ncbi:hypothetical protein FOZ63_027397 [Perkinsus olseni]|uniref:Uncharacterized protein n=1 Tax=Perkinsus olseni TaxID=32597 RepID=A0A7J6UIP5_PEROL|nr:hypothetical protein FOZ62_010299 [Perkinsus olseni]KAF4756926.1 hypothetical protein FOZ63_027397 [Perkinsus olseni]
MKFLSFVTLLLSISVGSAIQDDDAEATGNGGGDIDDGGHTHTIADYPSGCCDGPGPAQGHNFQFLDETAVCFYIRKGLNSNGRFQESAGVIFSTNAPGRVGEKAQK